MWTLVVLVLTVVGLLIYKANYRPPSFPPGPFAWPLLGNAWTILYSGAADAFKRYTATYGDIFSFNVFNEWSVMINDPVLMRTAFNDPAFSNRIALLLFSVRDKIITGSEENRLGILSTNGEVWKNQRRFTLRTLRDLGFGRRSIEPVMNLELEELLEYFGAREGEKLDIGLLFNRSIVNVIWAMVIGKRFSHSDDRLHELVDKVQRMLQSFNPFHPLLRFSWIKKLFPNLKIIRETEGVMKDLLQFIQEEMVAHDREAGDHLDESSYIGAYCKEMMMAAEEGRDSPLTSSHLKANILELFLAGSETTSTTLWWAIYLLASNQEAQRAMQEELDRVVGRDNLPTLEHMDIVPQTTATIYEVQRLADLVPFAVPHMTTMDATLHGYAIPKGTTVMFHLSHGLKDPKYWKYPDKFYPKHFLTPEGKVFKPDQFMPFGHGKRVCLGESLARLELFLFLTTLMHRFSWRLTDDPIVWQKSTVINRPPSYTIIATRRKDDLTETMIKD